MKILFISHDASRTGAPLLLLYLLQWLKSNTNIEIHVLLKTGGDIEKEFLAFDGCYNYRKPHQGIPYLEKKFLKLFQKVNKNFSFKTYILNKIKKNKFDYIYANSAASSELLNEITELTQSPSFLHVHELERIIQESCNPHEVDIAIKKSLKTIVGSNLVKNNLIANHHADPQKMSLVYDFVSFDKASSTSAIDIRKKHGVDQNKFLVAGCGKMQERKGVDLFIEVARIVALKGYTDKIHFMWVGGDKTTEIYQQMNQLIVEHGLMEMVTLVENVSNIYDYYNGFDLFFLSSKEDPFPLVCIEAGYYGSPIICFKDCTGTQEVVDDTCGGVFDLMDLEGVSEKIIQFSSEPAYYKSAQIEIKNRMKEMNVDNAGEQIVRIIKSC